MNAPWIAHPKPYLTTLQAGRTYLWCSCGRSQKQPFCDGSHKGTGFEPRHFVAERTEEVLLRGCKRTSGAPFCDGAHTNLPGGSPVDDPESPSNREIAAVLDMDGPRRRLDGGCYVFCPDAASSQSNGTLRYCRIVGPELGAQYQSQYLLDAVGGQTPPLGVGDSDAIVLVGAGSGELIIAGRRFAVEATDGAYLRPGEALQLVPRDGRTLQVYLLVSPPTDLTWLGEVVDNFDDTCPQRIVSVDAAQRTAMGLRYFQLLVDKRIGSRVATQFIGHIPRSKAAPHRHLYEETIIVLAGRGWMWTESRKARVAPGDVIFLPRKQLHSLEAIDAEGMFVVGVICPGDNPSINYYD